MGAPSAVRARGITKCFGDVVALDAIDFDVAPGRVHGLVGPNGAGKTTLLGLLLGLAVADEGDLEILGAPVGKRLAAHPALTGEPGTGVRCRRTVSRGDGPALTPKRMQSDCRRPRGDAGRTVETFVLCGFCFSFERRGVTRPKCQVST